LARAAGTALFDNGFSSIAPSGFYSGFRRKNRSTLCTGS
jgi:hypothetical protein